MTVPMRISSRVQVWPPLNRRMGGTRRHADKAEVARSSAAMRCSAIVTRRYWRSASERRFDRMRRYESPVASWRDIASALLLVLVAAAALLTNVPLQLPHRDHQVHASGFACGGLSPTGSPIASP